MIRSTEQTLYRLDNLNAQQERISYQISTGKKLQYGSDDANLYTREIYIDDKIRVYEGLKIQIEKTTAQNNTSDSTLDEAKDLLTYVKAEVIKALNATTDDEAKQAIAVNLKGVKENLYALSNEQVEGEYLFAGSNSIVKPFEELANGKVVYNGDAHLRKIAVEDGSYRERGISGFETFMYTSDSAKKGESLEFTRDERVLDQDGFEWKLSTTAAQAAGTTISGVTASTALVDENGKTWSFNSSDELVDNAGNLYSGTVVVTATGGPYDITVPNSTGNETLGVVNQVVKFDEDGEATSDTLAITTGVDKEFSITVPNVNGNKFEAKTSAFDVMDRIINALEKVDDEGNSVSDSVALTALQGTLGEISEAFESANIGHAKLGGRNKVFEISLDRVSTKLTQYNILSQEVGAADLSKVAVESKALELTYTALYSTINRISELSLVNFVR